MATSRAKGERGFKCKAVEEDQEDQEEEEEEEEEEEGDHDIGDLGFGEDEKKQKREMTTSSCKRTNGGTGGSTPVVVCQVENCNADLADAKPYHRRHKVCEIHFKAPAVLLHGLQKRFCQQCSRFHLLSEFDENKRSCRTRLAGHNERRRKSSFDVHGEGSH